MSTTGVLLINLGTPADHSVPAVRKYLREFLFDPRVIELPTPLRWLLLQAVILPFRAKKSAHAYASIWQPEGSPLLVNSKNMQQALQQALGDKYVVTLGMRYGAPSVKDAIQHLYNKNVERILILPLFPQYSSAANGSAIEHALKILATYKAILPCEVISDFYTHNSYIAANVARIKPYLANAHDFLLLSFHGLPERQLINPGVDCYRTRCVHTAQLIADGLELTIDKWAFSFQSRLGRLPWIQPYTDNMLIELRERGIKDLLVACPSFVADCLETLEEIGIRAKQQWLQLGGANLTLVPCLNAEADWINALQDIIRY